MEEEYIDYIVKQYFKDENYYVKQESSGMNNTTKFLCVGDKKYILRIYESHRDSKKVNYEHLVLEELNKRNLSFNIPKPKQNLKGNTISVSIDEKLVSIAEMIKGSNPKLHTTKQFYSLGKVVGEITKELGSIEVELNPIYEPCYELEKSYPKCPLNKVIEFCIYPSNEFENEREYLKELSRYFIEFQEVIPKLRSLPHQIIHGDINASNVLEDEYNNISAVLDFEFSARDLRAMDLAICLSEAISNENDDKVKLENMRSFINGYKEYIKLSIDEIKVIPSLIMLRRLDVIIHFLVRYKDGISNNFMSSEKILKEQIIKAITLCKWVKSNEEKIRRLF